MKIPSEIKNFNDRLFNKASLIFKIRRTVILWLLSSLSFLILLFFSTNVFLNRDEDRAHLYTIDALQTILNSSHQGIKEIWLEGFFIDATLWVSDPILLQNTKELLKMPRDSQVLMYSEAMHNIRAFFKQRIKHHNALGIFIISPDYVSLVSMSDQNIGKINLMVNEQKERYFRTVLNNAVNGIIIINQKGIIESFNLAAQNIFGYTADEVIGKNVSMLANVKDRNQHDTYLRNYIKTRIPKIIGFNREVIGVRKKGSKFPLRLGVSKIEFKDRMVFMGMITDLTLEKEAEKALYEIEERFKNTFDQVPISIANTDLNGRFQKMNHAFCALFGYSEKELLKMVFGEITFSDDIEESKSRMKELIDRRIRKFSLEKRYVKKNGKLMWGNVTVSALTDKYGNINNLIAIV